MTTHGDNKKTALPERLLTKHVAVHLIYPVNKFVQWKLKVPDTGQFTVTQEKSAT